MPELPSWLVVVVLPAAWIAGVLFLSLGTDALGITGRDPDEARGNERLNKAECNQAGK